MSVNENQFYCEYCKETFKSKSNLSHHQKTAKYCLTLQGKNGKDHVCQDCQKQFTTISNLEQHYLTCKTKKKRVQSESVEQIKIQYNNIIVEKDKMIDDLKHQVQDLQNKLYELASRPQQVVNSNSNNNNTNHTNKIMNLQMITQEHLNSQAQHLTLEHIKKGAVGYGEYFLDHPLKDRVVCTDFSRRKIKYKNENGEIITDPELTILSESLFKSIRERNRELAMQYTKELTERFANKNDPAEMSYFMDLATKFSEQDIAVGKMLDGARNDMFHDIIRHICSKSMQQ